MPDVMLPILIHVPILSILDPTPFQGVTRPVVDPCATQENVPPVEKIPPAPKRGALAQALAVTIIIKMSVIKNNTWGYSDRK